MPLKPPIRQKRTTIYHFAALAAIVAAMVLLGSSARGQVPVNEAFELNIAERHIVETSFHRGTEIGTESGPLRLRVGASADAGTIDVTLRGVSGRVRFHADLGPLTDRLRRLAALGQGRR